MKLSKNKYYTVEKYNAVTNQLSDYGQMNGDDVKLVTRGYSQDTSDDFLDDNTKIFARKKSNSCYIVTEIKKDY